LFTYWIASRTHEKGVKALSVSPRSSGAYALTIRVIFACTGFTHASGLVSEGFPAFAGTNSTGAEAGIRLDFAQEHDRGIDSPGSEASVLYKAYSNSFTYIIS